MPVGMTMTVEKVDCCSDGNASPCPALQEARRELDRLRALLAAGRPERQLQSAFLNNTSHELRTPLTTILGMAELLEDGASGPLNDEQLMFLKSIQGAAVRLTGLVDDLLDLAQLEAGVLKLDPAEADVKELLTEVAAELRPEAAKRGLTLAVEPVDGAICARLDERRVRQALRHLVTNALKFTPPGGTVRLTAALAPDHLEVDVHDTGIGLEAGHLARVFEKFYQVDDGASRSHDGAGLGLTLAKGYIEAHGGRMVVESHPGDGSCFGFRLPRR